MPRLSVNEMTTYRWTFEEDVAGFVAAGIPSMGVWRQKLADFGEEKGAELLADHGLAVSNVLWAGGFTGSDGRTHRESLEDAEEAVRLTAALGAQTLVVYSGARNGHTHKHARRLMRGALTELVPLARELDVILAIEPMHPDCAEEWTLLTNIEDTLELLSEVNSPYVQMVFDTYHLCQSEQTLELLPKIVEHIAIVHLGDCKTPPNEDRNRCRLGEGCLPLERFIQIMEGANYRGHYDVELMGEEIEACCYHQLLAHCRTFFDSVTKPKLRT
jgi:sugar phosphate isomerase/epimerase